MNDTIKYLYHKYRNRNDKWFPFITVFYLTNSCDFRCPYCSDGKGKPDYQLSHAVLKPEEVIKLIGNIRRHTNHLVITGGEPLNYPEVDTVLSNISQYQFEDVVFTTNGYNIDNHLESINQSVTTLTFSLDTLDEAKADGWHGIGGGSLKKILHNIDLAERLAGKKYEIYISAVATPDNIDDLYKVYEYSQSRGFTFALAPQLIGTIPNQRLGDHKEYYKLFNFLLQERKKGRKVFGSPLYLEYMRDLRKFQCKPFTMLVVSSLGDVYYPCLEIGHYAGNLLLENDLHKIRVKGEAMFGKKPNCPNCCQSACALGFGLMFSHPTSMMYEAMVNLKTS